MNGFERRTMRKKKDICRAAFELFCTQGVQKTSIAQIAKKPMFLKSLYIITSAARKTS